MKNKLFFLLFFILFYTLLYAQQDRLIFKNITTIEGLSSNRVKCIYEDSKGLIWLGTGDGINLYDSHTIKHIYGGGVIRAFAEDKQNSNLYIATMNGLLLYDRKKHRYSRLKESDSKIAPVANNSINSIHINNKNELYVASFSSIYICNPERTEFLTCQFDSTVSKNRISALNQDKNGQIIIGTNKGIYTINLKEKKLVPLKNSSHIKAIQKLFTDSRGNLWICTYNNGLYCYENTDYSKQAIYYPPENEGGFMINLKVRDMIEFEEDKFYFMIRNGGLVYWDRKKNIIYKHTIDKYDPQGLPSKALESIYKDSKGNIWLGTYRNGLCMIDKYRKKFNHFKMNFKDDGIINNNVATFLQDWQGDIWVGTDNGGGLSKFNRKKGTFKNYYPDYNNPNGLHDDYVLFLEELDNDRLLLGTLKEGIEIFNKKTEKFSHYPINNMGNSNKSVFCIKKDLQGNIWAAGGTMFFKFHLETGVFELIDGIKRVESIEQTHKDSIWLGTFGGGLIRFNINDYTFNDYTSPVGETSPKQGKLPTNAIRTVRKDSKNNLWIGTNGRGICYKKNNSNHFETFNIEDGLVHNQISDIQFENDSILWISTSNGLSRFDYKNKTFRNYDVHDGLQGNEFGMLSSMKAKNGELYFAGRNGFTAFNPKNIEDNPIVPNLIFTDFKLFNKSVAIDTLNSPFAKHISLTKELTLTHEQSVFTLYFSALNFSSSEKNQYAYILEGFDKEWNYVGYKNEATYTNLSPGNYTFRVKASNNDNVWNNDGLSLQLTILPPWWNTWWFRTFSAIVIIGGSLLFFLLRMKQMKERQTELENKVNKRTSDLQEANIILEESREEISQQNEELEAKQTELEVRNAELAVQKHHLKEKNNEVTEAYRIVEQKNNNIKASISYAKTIQTAILPTPATMNATFNNFVLFLPKDIVSGDFFWMSRIDDNTSIIAAVDCTGHGVPGAFMSMIGSRLLSSIVNEQKIHSPKNILAELHLGIHNALKQDTSENDDGMDVCLCKIETKKTVKITFSGAKRPLYHFDSKTKQINRIKGCLNSIGGNFYLDKYPYQNIELEPTKGDVIYLTSDGYMDQNNSTRKSFGSANFNQLLKDVAHLQLDEQKTKIEETLISFMQGEKQRDDITVIGIKF